MTALPTAADVEAWLARAWVAAPGTSLRAEERRKAAQLPGLLAEVQRALPRGRREVTLVDAAAGKAYVGLLVARLLLVPAGRTGRVVVLERDAARAQACRDALARLELPAGSCTVDVKVGDVAEASLWPAAPDLVVALHACGDATDHVLEQACRVQAQRVLVAPCCVAAHLPDAQRAQAAADAWRVPRQAGLRRPLVESLVNAARVLRLEAAGYQTEVVAFAPPTVTPHNVVLRARRVGEPVRRHAAQQGLAWPG